MRLTIRLPGDDTRVFLFEDPIEEAVPDWIEPEHAGPVVRLPFLPAIDLELSRERNLT